MNQRRSNWIHSAPADSIFVLSPPFLCLLAVIIFPGIFSSGAETSPAAWFLLVLCVDVAHVYSTLYRTYFDREMMYRHRTLLLSAPVIALAASVILYALGAMVFWHVLAYFAVFHFIRQQYGFMRIYSRNEQNPKWMRMLDAVWIYACTLYPVAHWHFGAPRKFTWFVQNDFFLYPSQTLLSICMVLYFALMAAYVIKELILITQKKFNIQRNILIAGTALTWYMGIIWFNGDLTFTLLNVVSHGIPYMALIWFHGRKKLDAGKMEQKFLRVFFQRHGWTLFIGLLIFIAYFEEGLWELFVWKDHPTIFPMFSNISFHSDTLMVIIVPLLAMPQITHYIIDGFIWKIRNDRHDWKNVTLG